MQRGAAHRCAEFFTEVALSSGVRFAELCWSGAGRYSDFENRLKRTCVLLNLAGIQVMSQSGWNPKGKARRQEAIGFFTTINAGLGDNRAETVESAKPSREFGQAFMTKFLNRWIFHFY